jgi:multidrug efflux system membrane fusion protein
VLAQGQVTILDSGVAAGENVVVDGADRLRQGAPVVASQARQAGAGQGSGGQGSQGQGSAAGDSGKATGKQQHKEQQ